MSGPIIATKQEVVEAMQLLALGKQHQRSAARFFEGLSQRQREPVVFGLNPALVSIDEMPPIWPAPVRRGFDPSAFKASRSKRK